MSTPERPDHVIKENTHDYSLTKMFHDAYEKSVTAIKEHPAEAAIAAIGAISVGAATLYLSRERAFPGVLGRAAAELSTSKIANPEWFGTIRAASVKPFESADLDFLKAPPVERGQALGAMDDYMKAGYQHVPIRTGTADLALLRLPPWARSGAAYTKALEAPPMNKGMLEAFDHDYMAAGYRHVPYREAALAVGRTSESYMEAGYKHVPYRAEAP